MRDAPVDRDHPGAAGRRRHGHGLRSGRHGERQAGASIGIDLCAMSPYDSGRRRRCAGASSPNGTQFRALDFDAAEGGDEQPGPGRSAQHLSRGRNRPRTASATISVGRPAIDRAKRLRGSRMRYLDHRHAPASSAFTWRRRLLDDGHRVVGFDGMTPYYDVALKERRHAILASRTASRRSSACWRTRRRSTRRPQTGEPE